MANLLKTLIETIEKDLAEIRKIEDKKSIRKECSLLLSRIESAKKLCSSQEQLLEIILKLEEEIYIFKSQS